MLRRSDADHVVVFPQMIMKRPGEFMMIAFFQTMFVFGHRPWKVADPKSKDHMGVGAFNLIRRSTYEAVGTYEALRMEVLDDMKLGKVVKNAAFAQRNVFGEDLISIRWARGARGVVENLTKNFFAVLSFQWWRTLIAAFGLAFLNLMPFLGVWLAHGWERLPYAHRAGVDVFNLCGHVVALGGSGLLLPAASRQHGAVCVYLAALHVPCVMERRHHLARDAVSAGGVEEGNGVRVSARGLSPYYGGGKGSREHGDQSTVPEVNPHPPGPTCRKRPPAPPQIRPQFGRDSGAHNLSIPLSLPLQAHSAQSNNAPQYGEPLRAAAFPPKAPHTPYE